MTTYQRNFLSRVIFQLKYDPILTLEAESPAKFQERITSIYPGLVTKKKIEVQANIKDGKLTTQLTKERQVWEFQAADKKRSLAISADEFSLVYSEYKDKSQIIDDLHNTWPVFQALYNANSLSRVGLRYINKISIPDGNPLEWTNIVNEDVRTSTFISCAAGTNYKLSRSLHEVHWVESDHRIALRYGIHNPDFPNPIAKREFLIDIDCVSIGEIRADDAEKCLVSFNTSAESFFEKCIGDTLRERMRSAT